MPRVMLKISKGESVKYISHLDLVRSFEFALRRARVPVAYSEGFNPRPKMSFGSAVGVGVTSGDERITVELTDTPDTSNIVKSLNNKLPSGLRIVSAEEIPEGTKSPLSALNVSRFRIEFDAPPETLKEAAERLSAAPQIPIRRMRGEKTRELDIRPYLKDIKAKKSALEVGLGFGNSGGAGVLDFIQAVKDLIGDIQVTSTHRIEQLSE